MFELNKDYEKAARIILDPNYNFNDTSKRIAQGYLNHDFDGELELWDKMFNDIINHKYVLSVPMRLKAGILIESRFHNLIDEYGMWVKW